MKAHVLVATRNLPPLQGGMERLNWHLIDELTRQHKIAVCGPQGCRTHLPRCAKVYESPLRPLPLFLIFGFVQTLFAALIFRPKYILSGSGLMGPTVWVCARLVGANAIGYLHGLDIVADHLLYRALWLPALRRLDLVFVNSRYTASLAVASGLNPKKIRILHPGVLLPSQCKQDLKFREEFDLGDRPLVLSVGRLTHRKGLAEFVENALPTLVEKFPRIVLVIIGDDAKNALGPVENQRARIEAIAQRLGLSEHVRLVGRQSDAMVASAYTCSQLLILPVLDLPNDVEGFGMVALEAAAHGLPTIAFASGGVTDAVADHISGRIIAPGDYKSFSRAVEEFLCKENDGEIQRTCREHAHAFRWEAFGVRLRKIMLHMDEFQSLDRIDIN